MKKAIQIRYNEDFASNCEYAAQAGFKHISVNFSAHLNLNWETIKNDILSILELNKLECVQTHLPYYDLRISSEILDNRLEDYIMKAIALSGKISAKWCVYHPRTSVSSGFRSNQAIEDNRRTVSGYLDQAIKNGTGIALENLPIFHEIVPVMPFFSSDFEDLCILADSFNDDKMAICWDTGHANLMHFDQADAIRYAGKRIVCTHIHDNNKNDDHHYPPTMGNINWQSVMGAFAEIGYEGPFTLETLEDYAEKHKDAEMLKGFMRFNYNSLGYIEGLMRI